MPSRSCSPATDRRRLALAAAALSAAVAWRPLAAATVEQRTVDVEIRADGVVVERTHQEVRLTSATDVDAWSSYSIFLDDNRQLDSCSAWVRLADGRSLKVGREGFDTVESLGGAMILHSSQKVRVVHFPAAVPGGVVGVDYQVTVHPYFPGGSVALGGADAIANLHVRVHGAGSGWRWRITGQTTGLAVAEAAGEVTVAGTRLPPAPILVDAPDGTRRGPALRYAWGEVASWAAVGSWYDGVTRGLPHGSDEVRRQVHQLIAAGRAGGDGGADRGDVVAADASPAGAASASGAEKRRRLASLLAFLRREVRYVAVEVGIGGFRPAPARDTFARRWGDCKAKASLLIEMLAEAGVEAYPALITFARRDRIDPEFPTPFAGFNHMIAAVPAAQLATAAGDPIAGGYLFVDPTLERGGIAWLAPGEQDQMALVLRGDRSELVRTPLLPALDSEELVLDLTVRVDGSASGRLQLDVLGEGGQEQIERLAHDRPEAIETAARRLIAAWFPAATVAAPRWRAEPGDEVPHATLTADVTLPSLVALSAPAVPVPPAGSDSNAGPGSGVANAATATPGIAVRWLALGGPAHTPAPGLTRNRDLPIVLTPRVAESRWRLTLPAGWCPDQDESTSGAEHPLGAFRQSLRCTGGTLFAVRRVEIRQRWIEPQDFAALFDIALAEHRANARRLRLDRLSSDAARRSAAIGAGLGQEPPGARRRGGSRMGR